MTAEVTIGRRTAIGSGLALVAAQAVPTLAQTPPPTFDPDFAQPLLAQARRVIAALARLGEPLRAEALAPIDRLEASGDLIGAARAAMALFDQRTLLIASITAEARVSVARGAAVPELAQAGWRVFLIRIDNPAMVPGKLDATSPQGRPANNRYPAGHRHDTPGAAPDRSPVTPGTTQQRWLDLEVYDAAPLPAALEPVPVEYRLLSLFARDAGRRAAQFYLDIGPGTGDIGDRSYAEIAFAIAPAKSVTIAVADVDGTPTTCSLLVRDRLDRVYPAQTKRVLPDLYFQKKIYRADGETLTLPPGEYQVEVARGPEYLLQRSARAVLADRDTRWSVKLERWIDPRDHGYYSGDHHIHAAGCSHYEVPDDGVAPSVMIPQMAGEAINIGAALTWGPGFYTQKLNFSGRDDAVSRPQHRLHYDLEVSGFPSSHCGHLVLLQMKGMDYPGTTKIEQWPSSNTPVLDWARRQGAVTGYAHSGFGLWADTTDLPNYKMPAFDGIGANDYIVTVTAGLVDFISTVSSMPAAELNIWYHTLNAGYRTRIAGETDWPCVYDENMGMGRSYVKLPGALSYDGWCAGLKAGRSYVSEGRAHLIDFTVKGGGKAAAAGDADLAFAAPQPLKVSALVAARLEPAPTPATEAIRAAGPQDKPYWHLERARIGATRKVLVELIVNGVPVESRPIDADGVTHAIAFDYVPTASCWIALRIAHGAHTNPVWVTVAAKPVRVARSIAWCRAAVDQCWSQKKLRIRPAEIAAEATRYDAARAIYDARAKEAAA